MTKYILALIITGAGFAVGALYDKVPGRVASMKYGPSAFAGQSIARMNRLDHYAASAVQSGDTLIYGDSLVELTDFAEIGRDPSMLNRGISGDRIAAVATRVDANAVAAAGNVVIMTGINDLLAQRSGADIDADIARLVGAVCMPDVRVTWLSVLPVNPGKFRREILSRTPSAHVPTQDKVDALNRSISGAAAGCPALTFFDITDQFADADGNLDAAFTVDGLHLSWAGSLLLTDILLGEKTRRSD